MPKRDTFFGAVSLGCGNIKVLTHFVLILIGALSRFFFQSNTHAGESNGIVLGVLDEGIGCGVRCIFLGLQSILIWLPLLCSF